MNRDLLVNYFDYHSLVTALVVAEEFTPAPNLKMLLPSQVEKHRQSVETFQKDLERRTSALKEAIQRLIVNIYKADGALGEDYPMSEMHALTSKKILSLWVEGIPHSLMEDSTGTEWFIYFEKGEGSRRKL